MANWWDKYESEPQAPAKGGAWWEKYESDDAGQVSGRASGGAGVAPTRVGAPVAAPEDDGATSFNVIPRGVSKLAQTTVLGGGLARDVLAESSEDDSVSPWGTLIKRAFGKPAKQNAGLLAANEFAGDLQRNTDELFPKPLAQAQTERELSEADGALETLGALARNPLGSAQLAGESLASSLPAIRLARVVAGSGLASGAEATTVGEQFDAEFANLQRLPLFGKLRELVGDDAINAAAEGEKARRIQQTLIGASAGGAAAAGLTSRLGLNPIDEMVAGRAGAASRVPSTIKEIAGEAFEGGGTQAAVNAATGRPLLEQVPESAAMEAALGGVTAAPVDAFNAARAVPQTVRNIRETIRQANSAADLSASPMAAAFEQAAQAQSRATTARILGDVTPAAEQGAAVADEAFRSAGVGTVAAADMAEQDALERDLDSALRDQLGTEAEIDSLLTGGINGRQAQDAPDGRNAGRANVPPVGIGGLLPQGVRASYPGDQGEVDASVGVDGAGDFRGRDALPPQQFRELADGSVFVPGDPVLMRQRLTDAGSQWRGAAQVRDGIPGVRFGRNAWPEVQGVVGGSVQGDEVLRGRGSVEPSDSAVRQLAGVQPGDGYSPAPALDSDVRGLRGGPVANPAPVSGSAGNAGSTQPTQAEAAVDGTDSRGITPPRIGDRHGTGIAGIESAASQSVTEGRNGTAIADRLDQATPPALRDLTDERGKDTNPAGRALRKRWTADFDGALTEYSSLSGEFNSDGGRILNTDIARELSPEYRADRTRSADVHEASSDFIKAAYAAKLAQPTPSGMDPVVLFTAGGTGAGKTTGQQAQADALGSPEIIYDTNMNGLASSVNKIEQALAAGRQVDILYTYRDPVEALTGGALPRAARMEREQGTGRTVPIEEHAKTHVGAYNTIKSLREKYASDDRVQFVFVDNSRGRGNAVKADFDELPPLEDNEGYGQATQEDRRGRLREGAQRGSNALVTRLREVLDAEYAAGRISESVYRGFVGTAQDRADAEGVGDVQPNARAEDAVRAADPVAQGGSEPVRVRDNQRGGGEGSARDGVSKLRSAISRTLGPKFLRRLESQPWFNLVESLDQLPPDVRKSISGEGIAGFVLPDGRVFIVADAVGDNATGVVLHEVGVHFGMSGLPDFPALLREFKAMRARMPAVDRAYKSVPEDTDASLIDEEAFAYFVEQNWSVKSPLMTRIKDAIARLLNRLGIPTSGITDALMRQALDGMIAKAREAADGASRGVVTVRDGKIVYSRDAVPEPDKLVALHNVSPEGLLFADKIGGLAVPSIGITKAATPFTGFGSVTLIGSRDLATPSGDNPVFSADAFTQRFPDVEWPAVAQKKASELLASLDPDYRRRDTGEVFDALVNKPDRDEAIRLAEKSAGFMRAWLEQNGESAPDVMEVKKPREGWMGMGVWLDAVDAMRARGVDVRNIRPEDAEWAELSKVAVQAIKEDARTGSDGNSEVEKYIVKLAMDRLPGGILQYATADRAISFALGRNDAPAVDRYGTRKSLEGKIGDRMPQFSAWVASKIAPLFGEPSIRIGRKKVPMTLGNVVEAMTTGNVAGKEKTLTFGTGKAKAMNAKQYRTLEEIQADRAKIVAPEVEKDAIAHTDKLLDEYRTEALLSFGETNWQGRIDTWAGLDAATKALADAAKKAATPANVRAALVRNGFRMPSPDAVRLGVESLIALRETVTDYFEAKPQRAVKLSEFAGAVVKESEADQVRPVLEKHGVEVREYSGEDAERRVAIDEFTKELEAKRGKIRFSRRADGGSDTIEVDGKQRPTTDSTGKAIHPTEEGLRNFWRWFGDSKVVDAEGRPLVVYHGTPKGGFDRFNTRNKKGATQDFNAAMGAHFTESQGTADRFAEGLYGEGDAPQVYRVYLKIDNPLSDGKFISASMAAADEKRWNAEIKEHDRKMAAWHANDLPMEEFAALIENEGIDAAFERQNQLRGTPPQAPELPARRNPVSEPALVEISTGLSYDAVVDMSVRQRKALGVKAQDALKAQGYDGVSYRNSSEREGWGTETWIIFDPTQAKSADSNSGTFSPADARIAYSRKIPRTPEQEAALAKAGMPEDRRTLAQRGKDYIAAQWASVKELASSNITQSVFDRFHRMSAIEQDLGIPAERSAYLSARLAAGLPSIMEGLMMYAAPKWEGGVLTVDDTTVGLLDALKPVKDDINGWLGWMVGRRAKALKAQGRENLMTDTDIDALLSLSKGREAEFKDAALKYLRIKRAVLDVAEQAGLIDPVGRLSWDSVEYIPFYRQDETEGDTIGPGTRQGLSSQSSGIKKLKGGQQNLADPLGNIVRNFTRLIDASLKNNAMLEAVKEYGPTFFEKVPMSGSFERIALSQVKKVLLERGVPQSLIDAMPQDTLTGLTKLWAVKPPADDDVVRVMRDGKPEYYRVPDKDLLASLTAFKVPAMHWALSPFKFFKRLLTVGVTSSPDFMARNFVRDSLSSWVISDDKFRVGWDSVKGVLSPLLDDTTQKEMMFAGGSFIGGQFYNVGSEEATADALRRALRDKGLKSRDVEAFLGTIARTPLEVWDKWQKFGSYFENANRNAIYENAIKAGRSKKEAAYLARDLMDFSMHGNSAFIQFASDVLPFFNARLQGLYKLYRQGGKKALRKALLMRAGTVAGFTLSLMAWNMMMFADGYDELEEWDKDTYWHFFPGVPGWHTRIPKPFELGVLFATVPERLARAVTYQIPGGDAGDRPRQTLDSFLTQVGGTLAMNPIPQGVMPIVEQWANKTFFTGRPIENMGDEKLLPEARAEWYTSDTARVVSDVIGNKTGLSPKRIEHLWNGYTGTIGAYSLDAVDWLVRSIQDKPERPELAWAEMPLLKAFYRGDMVPKSTRYTTEFYDLALKTEQISNTIKDYVVDGQADKAKALEEKHADLLGGRERSKQAKAGFMHSNVRKLNKAKDELAKIRKEIEGIVGMPGFTDEQKRAKIDALAQKRNEITRDLIVTLRRTDTPSR